jgi:hypothetical protein
MVVIVVKGLHFSTLPDGHDKGRGREWVQFHPLATRFLSRIPELLVVGQKPV